MFKKTARRLASLKRRIRIRTVMLLFMGTLLLLVLGSGYMVMQRHVTNDINTLSREQFTLLADTIRLHILDLKKAGSSMTLLQSTFESLRQQHREILELRFIRAKAVNRQFGLKLDFLPRDQVDLEGLTGNQPLIIRQQQGGEDVIRFVYPFDAERGCLTCHIAGLGERLGALSITYDLTRVTRYIRGNALKMQLTSLLEIILLLVCMITLLDSMIFRRLRALHEGTDRLARGDLTTYVEGDSDDEAGLLVRAFNRMARRIKELVDERDEKIRSQGDDLANLLEMSKNLRGISTSPEALNQFARMMTESVKVTCCRIALLDESRQSITVRASYPLHEIGLKCEESVYTKSDCPHLWHAMDNQTEYLVHRGDDLNNAERELLMMETAKSALCLPLMNSKVLGLVVLIEFRAEAREAITRDKLRYCWMLSHQLASGIENGYLQERLLEYTRESILALAETVDMKSPWTAGHSQRVTDYAVLIGKGMGFNAQQLLDLHTAGLLHDIGKIGTPGVILNKPGKLTEQERSVINRHPEDGARLLSKMRQFNSILPAVRYHHESYDGHGYPAGLRGEDIPLNARVLAVADSYDAMTSDRPYRQGLSRDQALAELQKSRGRQFDPEIVDVFIRCLGDADGGQGRAGPS